MIRALQLEDFDKIKQVHEKFYQQEFSLPDFIQNFICGFIVTDDQDNSLITAGGIRTISEMVLVTDKDKSVRARRDALYQVLDASIYMSGKVGYDQLHAFIQDEAWKKHLLKIGFAPCKGEALYFNL